MFCCLAYFTEVSSNVFLSYFSMLSELYFSVLLSYLFYLFTFYLYLLCFLSCLCLFVLSPLFMKYFLNLSMNCGVGGHVFFFLYFFVSKALCATLFCMKSAIHIKFDCFQA